MMSTPNKSSTNDAPEELDLYVVEESKTSCTDEGSDVKFVNKLANQNCKEAETISLKARAKNPQKHPFKWLRNGEPINTDSPKYEVNQTDEIYKLTVQDVNLADSGEYTIQIGKYTNRCNVNVEPLPRPPKIDVSHVKNISVMKGDVIELNIPFDGAPLPRAQWSKNGKHIDEDNFDTLTKLNNSRLRINAAQIADTGQYELTLSNEAGEDTVTVKITVMGVNGQPSSPPLPGSTMNVSSVSLLQSTVGDVRQLSSLKRSADNELDFLVKPPHPTKRHHGNDPASPVASNRTGLGSAFNLFLESGERDHLKSKQFELEQSKGDGERHFSSYNLNSSELVDRLNRFDNDWRQVETMLQRIINMVNETRKEISVLQEKSRKEMILACRQVEEIDSSKEQTDSNRGTSDLSAHACDKTGDSDSRDSDSSCKDITELSSPSERCQDSVFASDRPDQTSNNKLQQEKTTVSMITSVKTTADSGRRRTRGIIAKIRDLYQSEGKYAKLCSSTDHFRQSKSDRNWSCGFKTAQMLWSALIEKKEYCEKLCKG